MKKNILNAGDKIKEDGYVYRFDNCAKDLNTEKYGSETCNEDCIHCHMSLWTTVGQYNYLNESWEAMR